MPNVILTTVYDNYSVIPQLQTGWGFSCVAHAGDNKILFDTGANGSTLLSNMEKFNIDPNMIRIVVLSHNHSDHTGGLIEFLIVNRNVRVFIPKSFPDSTREIITAANAEYVDVTGPMEICECVHTTGELGDGVIEQSLIFESDYGLLVLTGCAHPGIINILKKAREYLKKDLLLALGGFHLKDLGEAELFIIAKELKNLGVQMVGPSHCSGDLCRKVFEDEFEDGFIYGGAGNVVGA